jgi:hypothetical protein
MPAAVLAETEQVDAADAVEARQRRGLDERVVPDVELVVALRRREQCTTIKRSGEFDGGDLTRRTSSEGAAGDGDAVLDQHLRLVEVGAEAERDGEHHLAVGRALRRM